MEKKEKNRNSYSELPEGDPAKVTKKESRKGKEIRILKKGKSIKEKNDPDRFSGDGINFRAKIIGIEDVLDARGNRMCQGALQKLKAAVKTSGDHKQRIILNISLNGIIIKDEKSEEVLHHHPIHKISCISQDTKDSRAFGFVYGCPQTGHRFFAIKTEKAASQVVVTLRDLFLVALEIKKKEIESTQKENGEQENVKENENSVTNGNTAASDFFPADFENQKINHDLLYSNTVLLPEEDVVSEKMESNPTEPEAPMDALLDLQSEVSILQQGISQMDQSIAHAVSQNLGVSFSEDEVSESSTSSIPTSFQFKLDKLSSLYHETMSISSRSSSTSDYNVCVAESKQEDNDTPRKEPFRNSASAASEGFSSGVSSLSVGGSGSASEISTTNSAITSTVEDKYAAFLDIDSLPSIFDNPGVVGIPGEPAEILEENSSQNSALEKTDEEAEVVKSTTPVAFAELDPLGNQPYVDKKDFFQELKNPPKKVLKELVGANGVFGGSDNEALSNSHECLVFGEEKFYHPEGSLISETMPPLVNPPKLPPKRALGPSPLPIMSELFQESGLSSNGAWEPINPFNPFIAKDYPDIPPPNSPPPPPPPRLPTKTSESSPNMSPPPPRPPSRVNSVPTPPLPKRKVPLSSTSRTWFSFDQDATPFPSVPLTASEPDASANNHIAPPLPSPSRKLPPSAKPESPLLKSSSASNSPATMRRLCNKSPYLSSAFVIQEDGDSAYSPYIENGIMAKESKDSKATILTSSPRKMLSRHSSIIQEENTFSDGPFMENGVAKEHIKNLKATVFTSSPRKVLSRHSSIIQEEDAFSGATFNPFLELNESQPSLASHKECRSPPLPPKPISISQPKPSPVKKMASAPCTASSFSSASVSVTESSNGTHSSSSLMFSSLDDNKIIGSSSEALFNSSMGSQSDVFTPQSSQESSSGDMTTTDRGGKQTDLSPDSIFRRKSDPFADDFFLTLHKKSTHSITKKSSTVVEVPFDSIKAPT